MKTPGKPASPSRPRVAAKGTQSARKLGPKNHARENPLGGPALALLTAPAPTASQNTPPDAPRRARWGVGPGMDTFPARTPLCARVAVCPLTANPSARTGITHPSGHAASIPTWAAARDLARTYVLSAVLTPLGTSDIPQLLAGVKLRSEHMFSQGGERLAHEPVGGRLLAGVKCARVRRNTHCAGVTHCDMAPTQGGIPLFLGQRPACAGTRAVLH